MDKILGLFTSFKTYLIVGALALVIGLSVWGYFVWSQSEIASLVRNLATMNQRLVAAEALINDFQKQAGQIARAQEEFNEKVGEIRKQTNDLHKMFDEVDLGKLGAEKPVELEKNINDQSKKLFKDIEKLTLPK